MAVTNENSLQIGRILAGAIKNLTTDLMGRMRKMRFDFTQGAAAGDATSTMSLIILPPGRNRIYLRDCIVAFSAFGAARVLDIGYAAYTDRDGNAVAAAPAAFVNDLDVSSAGTSSFAGVVGGEESFLFENRDSVTIIGTVAGGTIPAAATLNGDATIVRD